MTTKSSLRTSHPYYMYDCIQDTPNAIREVLESQQTAVKALGDRIRDARNVHIVGIGTSFHAALVGEYLLRMVAEVDNARAWNSFEFHSFPPLLIADDVVIVMSHRGMKRYSLWSLEQAKKSGAYTAIITGKNSKARRDLADAVIETSYQDKSSAFTISHSAAMTALAMLALEAGEGSELLGNADMQALPNQVAAELRKELQVQAIAKALKGASRWVFAGWGPNSATAYEVALKINEAAYLATNGYQLEYFFHGPFVATSQGVVVCLIAPPGKGYDRAVQLAKSSKETGATVVALVQEGDEEMSRIADYTLTLAPTPKYLTPIVYLAPLQLLTYWLALELGKNPDTFRLNEPRHMAAMKPVEL
ncbi:MAG: SIS domain-containing protein [Chloroflexi bacterium]|nr:SIS domain-containing protein [Chloroflexota bacterium]